MPKAKSTKTVHPTSVRFEEDIYKGLLALAQKKRESVNSLVNNAMEYYIAHHKDIEEIESRPKVIIG